MYARGVRYYTYAFSRATETTTQPQVKSAHVCAIPHLRTLVTESTTQYIAVYIIRTCTCICSHVAALVVYTRNEPRRTLPGLHKNISSTVHPSQPCMQETLAQLDLVFNHTALEPVVVHIQCVCVWTFNFGRVASTSCCVNEIILCTHICHVTGS